MVLLLFRFQFVYVLNESEIDERISVNTLCLELEACLLCFD